MRTGKVMTAAVVILCLSLSCGCGSRQDAYSNSRMKAAGQSDVAAEGDTEENGGISGVTADAEFEEQFRAGKDSKDADTDKGSESTTKAENLDPNAVIKDTAVYNCDISADKKAYDGHVDITVGDNYYATQINDWYMNFDQYEGKVVEIEGYYIGEFAPYVFVGRYGPSCPYCQGGYVCFEILAEEDLSQYRNAEDWIKVTGILRQGEDSAQGDFYYIEVLELEKMDTVGMETITN